MELCATPRAIPTGSISRHVLLRRTFFRTLPTASSLLRHRRRSPSYSNCLRASAAPEETTTVSATYGSSSDDEKRTEEVTYDDFLNETAAGADFSSFLDFLKKIDIKLESNEAYTFLVYGAGALAAFWISSAIVNTLDSIPLVPKVMEVVGLVYTIWFSYRYLIFKENRDELFQSIQDFKKKIIGSSDE